MNLQSVIDLGWLFIVSILSIRKLLSKEKNILKREEAIMNEMK